MTKSFATSVILDRGGLLIRQNEFEWLKPTNIIANQSLAVMMCGDCIFYEGIVGTKEAKGTT